MKVKVKETKGFEPINLTITIETQEDFDDFYARVAIDSAAINSYKGFKEPHEASPLGCYGLWKELRKLK